MDINNGCDLAILTGVLAQTRHTDKTSLFMNEPILVKLNKPTRELFYDLFSKTGTYITILLPV